MKSKINKHRITKEMLVDTKKTEGENHAVSLFESAAKLHVEAAQLHKHGVHYRANKCTIVAQTLQKIAAENMLRSIALRN